MGIIKVWQISKNSGSGSRWNASLERELNYHRTRINDMIYSNGQLWTGMYAFVVKWSHGLISSYAMSPSLCRRDGPSKSWSWCPNKSQATTADHAPQASTMYSVRCAHGCWWAISDYRFGGYHPSLWSIDLWWTRAYPRSGRTLAWYPDPTSLDAEICWWRWLYQSRTLDRELQSGWDNPEVASPRYAVL